MQFTLPTLDTAELAGKTVLVRLDLNVPMQAGRVTDDTRIARSLPTLQALLERHCKIVLISHFGRPEGRFDASQSLAPLVDALSEALWDKPVLFSPDCVGSTAEQAVANARRGDIILMENLRFHAEEEANDDGFARQLAALADIYVNDAFSCSHRAHASVAGVTRYLPSYAGRLMEEEVRTLTGMFETPDRPLAAVVGGSKVSSKLELLTHLVEKVDCLVIGGAMANTFLHAQGHAVGASLCETELKDTALHILDHAQKKNCRILLPLDVVVADAFRPSSPCRIMPVGAVGTRGMILDIGPLSLAQQMEALAPCRTLIWNGPLGAFETAPFDASTVVLARAVAGWTRAGSMHSVAGGGDTVAALAHAGLEKEFSYLSTAGGAFLEWLEGKKLPGVAALHQSRQAA